MGLSVLLDALDQVLFTILLLGKFSAEATGGTLLVQKGALAGTGTCEVPAFFCPYLDGYPGYAKGQNSDCQ